MAPALPLPAPTPRDIAAVVAPTLIGVPFETWNYGDSVGFEGLLAATDLLGDEGWSAFAHGWTRAWATRAKPYVRQDCTAPGLAIVKLARRYDDGQLLQAAMALAEYLLDRPRPAGVYEASAAAPLMQPYGPGNLDARGAALLADPPPGVFVDCLHFDPPFFASLAVATTDDRYLTAALDQATGYLRLLQRDDGLFDHFMLRGVKGTFGHGWGRGQGWALLGLLDVLEELGPTIGRMTPEHQTAMAEIRAAAASLVLAQVELQRADGHWYAVVNDPRSGDEHSTAAFMAAGFYRALTQGVVPEVHLSRVQAAADAAYTAMCSALDPAGILTEVSAAVMACTELSHYSHVPRGFSVPWGQGPVVLAAIARRDAEPR